MGGLVVFDVETDRLLDASRRNYGDLRITVAVACVVPLVRGAKASEAHYSTFFGDVEGSLEAMGELFDAAEAIVAYNGRGFDLRVLRNHLPGAAVDRWEAKLVDPFEVIRETTHSWVKLDELLEANGLPRKSGEGVAAVAWWAAGERGRVAEYCRHDVEGLAALLALGTFAFPIKEWSKTGRKVQEVTGWAELDWDAYSRGHQIMGQHHVDLLVSSNESKHQRL